MNKRKIHITGNIIAKYFGELDESLGSHTTQDYNISIYAAEIHNLIVCDEEVTYKNFDSCLPIGEVANVKLYPKNAGNFYKANLDKLEIFDPQIFDVVKTGRQTNGTLKGRVTALIYVYEPSKVTILNNPPPLQIKESESNNSTPKIKRTPIDWKQTVAEIRELISLIPVILGGVILSASLLSFIISLGIGGLIFLGILGSIFLINLTFPSLFPFLLIPVIGLFNWFFRLFQQSSGINLLCSLITLIMLIYFIESGYVTLAWITGTVFLISIFGIFGQFLKGIFGGLFYSLVALFTIMFLGSLMANSNQQKSIEPFVTAPSSTNLNQTDDSLLVTTSPPTLLQNDSFVIHNRIWNDYAGNQYQKSIKIYDKNFLASKIHRNTIVQENYMTDLSFIYQIIYDKEGFNYSEATVIPDTLSPQTAISLAEIIVSFVQDIPYCLLTDISCKDADKSYLCEGDVRFGLYTPTEFLYTLKGDCDTRTLLLYSILSNAGFDVVILGSTRYQHAVLGINLPLSGIYKNHQGKKYYVWETTSYGWQPGLIDPNCADMRYWEVLLSNHIEI